MDQSLKFSRIFLIIDSFENPRFLESVILIFFGSCPSKSFNIYNVEKVGWNFDDYPGLHQKGKCT